MLTAFLVLGGPYDRALTADLAADLAEGGGWACLGRELETRQIVPDGEEPLWVGGDSTYVWVCLRDEAGGWWKALCLRRPHHGYLDFHFGAIQGIPALTDCQPVAGEER